MRRRQFIAGLGSTARAWPLAVRMRSRPGMPVIGLLGSATAREWAPSVAAFLRGLSEAGFAEGRDVAIEYRWAENQYDRLPSLAAELIHRQVSVIAALTTPSAIAAKAATATIPIVFTTIADPVQIGLVASLNRPGGNLTGVTFLNVEIVPKMLELLHEVVPTATTMAALVNPTNPNADTWSTGLQVAARTLRLELNVLKASTERDIDKAFATRIPLRVGGRTCHSQRCLPHYTRGTTRRPGASPQAADDLPITRIRRGRRSNELRRQCLGYLPSSWRIYRPCSQGREACRPAGPANPRKLNS